MTFTRAEPTENLYHRLVSESGRWEIGLQQMLFGSRVRLGLCGAMTYSLDYCAGASPHDQALLLALVVSILQPLPESVTPKQIEAFFPVQKIKPMNQDPACFARLTALSFAVYETEKHTQNN